MKKKLVFILLFVAAIFLLAACGPYNQSPISGGPNASDAVTNNGSFIVTKGDFYYYINGKPEQSASNKFGEVIKGAITRVEKSKLYDSDAHKIIVPKIALNSYAGSGIYIFGEYIYYTSPNDEKNKEGNVEYTYLDVMRTKLDGTGTEKLMRHSSSSLQHRFYEKNGVVYFTYADTVESVSKIFSLNCATKVKTEIVAEYTGTAFFLTDKVAFTQNVYVKISDKTEQPNMTIKEQEEKQEEFEVAQYNQFAFCEMNSAEKTVVKKDVNYKYALTSAEKGDGGYYLFFTETRVDAGGTKKSTLKRMNDSLNMDNSITISISNTGLTDMITMGDGDGYIVQDTNVIKWVIPSDTPTDVKNKTLANETGASLYKVIENKLYFFLSDGTFCYFDLPDKSWIANNDTSPWVPKKVKILGKEPIDTIDTSWIKPAYLDGKWFFFNSAADVFNKTENDTDDVSMYSRKGYLFVYDMAKSGEEGYVPTRIGSLSSEDKETEDTKIEEENKKRAKEREKNK